MTGAVAVPSTDACSTASHGSPAAAGGTASAVVTIKAVTSERVVLSVVESMERPYQGTLPPPRRVPTSISVTIAPSGTQFDEPC